MPDLTAWFIESHRIKGTFFRGDAVHLPISRLRVYRGDSLTLRVTVKNEFEEPVDLTGATIVFTTKLEEYCEDYTYRARSDQGQEIVEVDYSMGCFEINVPYQDTEAWSVGWAYCFDIQVTFPKTSSRAAKRQTIVKGRIEVLRDITTED